MPRLILSLVTSFFAIGPALASAEECDVAFPWRIENGRTVMVCGPAVYSQRLFLFLNTRPGERVMRPDYGFSLAEFQGRPMTPETKAAMAEHLKATLAAQFEGIHVLEATVEPTFDEDRPFVMTILYKIDSMDVTQESVIDYI